MWSTDMSRCPACSEAKTCPDRKKIVQTLSLLNLELNTTPEFVDGPGDGLIIVACQWKPTETPVPE